MAAQRLRRWSNIVYMLYKWFVFTGLSFTGLNMESQGQKALCPVCLCYRSSKYWCFKIFLTTFMQDYNRLAGNNASPNYTNNPEDENDLYSITSPHHGLWH